MRNTDVVRGRTMVLVILGICVAISVVSGMLTVMQRGAEQVAPFGIRLILTLLFSILVYQGKRWARWVYGILLLISGALSSVGGFALLPTNGLAFVVLMGVGLCYISCFAGLLFSPDIQAFFRFQEQGKRVV